MSWLNKFDSLGWNEYLIFMAVFFGLVNFVAWIVLIKRQKLGSRLKAMAEKLVKSEKAFVDPILFLFGAAWIAGLALFYVKVPPKKEPECKTVTIIQTIEQKPPVNKKPPQIKPCNSN